MPPLRFYAGRFQEGRPAGLSRMLQDVRRRVGKLAQDDAQGHAAYRQGSRSFAPDPRARRPLEDVAKEAEQSRRRRKFRAGGFVAGRDQTDERALEQHSGGMSCRLNELNPLNGLNKLKGLNGGKVGIQLLTI